MKPRFLAFNGINSFSERAEIDFTELLEFGIFGIFGDTGSGKSTILDCIAFALYGNTRRGERLADIINFRSKEAYVHFEFEIDYRDKRRIYRVERSITRKENSHNVTVYEKTDGADVVVATGVMPARELLLDVIGLEMKDFEKCIALPQGEFAQFVKAPRSERLKLISRLFDLDRYGEKLIYKAGEAVRRYTAESNVLEASLRPYAEVTAEGNEALREEIARLSEEEERLKTELLQAREAEKRLSAALAEKTEYERTVARLSELEAQREEYDSLAGDLARLEKASAVVASLEEGKRLKAQCETMQRRLSEAKNRADEAETKYRESLKDDDEALDAEIEALVGEKAQAAAAAERLRRKRRAEERLAEITRAIHAENEFSGLDFDDRQRKLEVREGELGNENLLEYLESHGREALLRGEYAQFAEELDALTEKYPEIAADSLPLAEKYKRFSGGERIAFTELRARYEAQEKERNAIKRELLELEKLRGRDALRRQKLTQLSEEFRRIKQELEELGAVREAGRPEGQVEEELAAKRRQKRARAEARSAASAEHTRAQSVLAAAAGNAENAKRNLEEGRTRFRECLRAGDFRDENEAIALIRRYGNAEDAAKRYEAYRRDLAALTARKEALSGADLSVTAEHVEAEKRRAEELSGQFSICTKGLAVSEERLTRFTAMLLEKRDLEKRLREAEGKRTLYEKLKKLIDNNRFMEFVAEEHLETVAVNASGRLVSLTGGRYFLRYQGGFFVGDNFNGGELRGVNTLSGGETFLVSLSLALALGAEICARSLRPIEFFFLDEGFGTLDEQLIDTVMDSLEKLRSERFCIGIISHVAELKHRIERKLTVKKATEEHGSTIEK